MQNLMSNQAKTGAKRQNTLWSPEVKLMPKAVSEEEYTFLVAELAEFIYDFLRQPHQNSNQSTVTEICTTDRVVGRTVSNG